MKLIYIAHPFEGKLENAQLAEQWCAYLNQIPEAVFIVPWVPMVRHWDDSDVGLRSSGIIKDVETVKLCHGLVAIMDRGASFTSGLKREYDTAVHKIRVLNDWENRHEVLKLVRPWLSSINI